MKAVTVRQLEKDVDGLRRKVFVYETLAAEKEVRDGKVSGPYGSGKQVVKRAKRS